jgi:hypothetical protein
MLTNAAMSVGELLNNVSASFGGIVGVFQRHDFIPETQEVISTWEARCKDCRRR